MISEASAQNSVQPIIFPLWLLTVSYTHLVQQYGYYSEGESFTIADPNEIWIMEMIGKGPGIRGAVWVAVRVPDDCISAHANQSRIHQFDMNDKENCMYSPDVVSFARCV